MMNDVYTDGKIVDQRVKEYMEAHPKASYREAYSALIKLEDATDQEAREEFARRVPAYQSEFKKSYADAAQSVASHDADMINAFASATDLPVSIGDVMSAAKKATAASKVRLDVAVMRILEGERDVSKQVAGDWLDREAHIQINNLNLGSSIDQAYPVALKLVMAAHPEVTQQYQTGEVSTLSMRTIFRAWFKD